MKHHSETVMVWTYQNADCGLKKFIYCVVYYNFRHTFVPYGLCNFAAQDGVQYGSRGFASTWWAKKTAHQTHGRNSVKS